MSAATASRIDDDLRRVARDALSSDRSDQAERSDPLWARLRELGTELWLDTGNLEEASALWTRELTALTTNNTLANQVVQTGVMDDIVKRAVHTLIDSDPDIPEEAMIMDLGFLVNCRVALRLVEALDARVSVELHPSVADDIERTVYWAERYYRVCPERFTIKIPHSPEGLVAVAQCREKGIPINYTLGFSARQNYLAASLSNPNYVNVFLGRLNSFVSDNRLGNGKLVGEKATLASQAAIDELKRQGRAETQQIAASMRDAEQVADLAGVDVFTMPAKVAKAFIESNPNPSKLADQTDRQYEPEFSPSADIKSVAALWEVNEEVKRLAEELYRTGPTKLTGEEVREADADIGAGMFHRFSSLEVVDIREQGKIPNWSRWEDEKNVPLDDLFTQSALQSFAVDQAALDDRLRSLTRSK
jgi:transaldolase